MSFTVDVHHHILPDFFWRETNDAHNPVGGIAPPPWDPELMLSSACWRWPVQMSRIRKRSAVSSYGA
jgi:hypothetical protein